MNESYTVTTDDENFHIYPENKYGETIRVPINRKTIHITHKSGDTINLKHHLYRGEWRWNDSRCGSVTEEYVTKELARMLFNGSQEKAQEFIAQVA